MTTWRIVKVVRAVYPPDGPWHVYDENRDWDERIMPDDWLKEAVGARPYAFFKASNSADGWIWKGRYKGPKEFFG